MKIMNYLKDHRLLLISLAGIAYMMVMIPLYAVQEKNRMESTSLEMLTENLDNAMTLYAENCALCHGSSGQGIGSNPPLNNPGLASMDYDALYKVIANGLYNTTMPAWELSEGGPLTNYEVTQLAALMQYDLWELVETRVVNLGMQPLEPLMSEPDPGLLERVNALPDGSILAQGITLYSTQCVSCHGPDGMGTNLAAALNDPEVREQPPEDIEHAIRYGVSGTLMAGWQNILAADEVAALTTLIREWDTIPAGTIPEVESRIHISMESLQLGEELYAANCSFCHGPEGQGTPRAPALNVKGFLEITNDGALQQIISLGVPDTTMLPWETRMNEAEIEALVGFIRAWEPTAPEVAVPARGPGGTTGGMGPPWMR